MKVEMEVDAAALEQRAKDLVCARLEGGQSFAKLARELDVSPSWLTQWVGGTYSDPGIHRIGRILERLG